MPTDVPLRCRCGALRAVASQVSPSAGSRVVCYCDDCQAFARFLDRPDVLDAAGGTDLFQMAQCRVQITDGAASLRCVRLSEKGMHRWYAGCCNTPIGNTLGAKVPFIGVVHSVMDHDAHGGSRDALLGPPVAYVQSRFATGAVPPQAHPTASFGFILRTVRLMLTWAITSRGASSAFFDARTKQPRVAPKVLTASERDALRAPASAAQRA